ncbi:hypothetical protein [Clostridium tertium]|uniref:Uncharacterized protein n=1 Tax=Clostridium tertium TaxID=1559 RepID=A0A6N3F5W8_9CLOT
MSNRKKIIIGIAIIIVTVVIIIPLVIDYLVIGNNIPSNISNSEWVGFLGSYVGAIVGSLATLIGIFITINFTKKQAELDRENSREILNQDIKFAREQAQEDRRLSVMPYLQLSLNKNKIAEEHDMNILYVIDEDYNKYSLATLTIKNIGVGSVFNFSIKNICFNDIKIGYSLEGNEDAILQVDKHWNLLIDLRFKLEELSLDLFDKLPNGSSSITNYSIPSRYSNKGGRLKFTIEYSDILQNKYYKEVEIVLGIGITYHEEENWARYTEPEIRMNSSKVNKVYRLEVDIDNHTTSLI